MERLLREVEYFVTFQVLRRLVENGQIPLEIAQWANGALAKTYGVLRLTL